MNEFIAQIPHEWYWLFLLVSVFIENIFPPYPGDTVVVFSGFLVGAGHISVLYATFSILAGNFIGATVMYFFGLEIMDFILTHIHSRTLKKVFSRETLGKTHNWFEKHGFWAVVFSRFTAGLRFFISIVAGMVRMHFILFIFAFALATVIWNSILVYAGYSLGQNSERVLHYLKVYSGITMVIVILIVMVVLYRINKHSQEE